MMPSARGEILQLAMKSCLVYLLVMKNYTRVDNPLESCIICNKICYLLVITAECCVLLRIMQYMIYMIVNLMDTETITIVGDT